MRVHSRIFIYIHTMTRTYLHMSRSICFFFTSCFHFSINNIRYSYRLTSSTILFHRNILTPRMFSFCCVSSQCVFNFLVLLLVIYFFLYYYRTFVLFIFSHTLLILRFRFFPLEYFSFIPYSIYHIV